MVTYSDKKYYNTAQLFFVLISGLLLTQVVCGQSTSKNGLKNELSLTSVNDDYVPPFGDRYFTNGLNITFSRIINGRFMRNNFFSGQPSKTIIRLGIAHEMYTPNSITEHDPLVFDRPYAGYLFSSITLDTFWKSKHNLQVNLIVGIIGPKARAAELQAWWHNLIKYHQPEGWENQIENEPVINLGISYRRSWLLNRWVDAISSTGGEAGTGFNNLFVDATVRAGDSNPIDRSVITSSTVGGTADEYDRNEWYFFLGIKNSFVFHNTLIEGSLFRPDKNRNTKSAKFFLQDIRAGIVFSTHVFTWKATIHRLSPEVTGGDNHRYASIKMAVRF